MEKVFLFVLGLFLLSCSDDDPGIVEEGVLEHTFYESSSLATDYPYIVEGSNIVFHRFYEADDEPNIADDEYAEDFIFQIPVGAQDFTVTGDELATMEVLFNQYCFCAPVDIFRITGGEITGNKEGNDWHIDVKIDFEQGYYNAETQEEVIANVDSKAFSGIFKQGTRP